jgi:hypothetical protein
MSDESALDLFFGPKPKPQPEPDPQPDPGIYEGVNRPDRRKQYARRWYQIIRKKEADNANASS